MAREKNNFNGLHTAEYDIADVVFRAWYDADDNLLFVLDDTIDDFKGNVLLVMGSYGDRKWDDVLQNDMGIDLETVRPKKDNKYQKLDIEYEGLDIYARLIDANEHGLNIDGIVDDLIDFRDAAVRRAATVRLTAAESEIIAATDTANKARVAINALRSRRHNLRTKLARQRELIGREPTKQSASRILRTESQLDSNSEKLERAEKRFENAQRRIEIATEDADAARELLKVRRPLKQPVPKHKTKKLNEDIVSNNSDAMETKQDSVPAVSNLPVPEYDFQPQPQESDMADSEEVKPLLDKDPEILDEEIAFKPVAFDDIAVPETDENVLSPVQEYSDEHDDAPTVTVVDNDDRDIPAPRQTPVIDTINTVKKSEPADTDTTGQVETTQYHSAEPTRLVSPAQPVQNPVVEPMRPVSPITGVAPVRPVGGVARSKPAAIYYLLLILLVVLSIFTLWLYQKKNDATTPFGTQTVSQPDVIATEPVDNNPVDGMDDIQQEPVEGVKADIVEQEPVIEPEKPEEVVEPEEPEAPVQEEPIQVVFPNQNVLRAPEPEVRVVESSEDVLARKQAYGVASNKPVMVEKPVVRVTNVAAPDVIFDDDLVSVPTSAPQYEEDDYYDDDDDVYYREPEYVNYQNNNARGFGGYRESERNQRMTVHDGGQYSIIYDDEVDY